MATRHNGCVNPALANNDAGWGGEQSPTRQAVAGFDRPFAAQYTSGTFMRTAARDAVEGAPYILSVYVRPNNSFSAGGNIYIEWRDGLGGVISYSQGSYTLIENTVTRASMTATAPAGTATAQLVLDGVNYVVTTVDATMCLAEPGTDLLDYFDGDSDGGSWDGTPGNSTSTLSDTVTGVLDAALPAVGGSLAGAVTNPAILDAELPSITGAAAGTVTVRGQLQGVLPPLAADLAGALRVEGALDAQLAAVAAGVAGVVEVRGPLDGALPSLTGALSGAVQVEAILDAELPALVGSFAGQVPTQGAIDAALPAVTGSFDGTSDAVAPDLPPYNVGPPRLAWQAGTARLAWPAGRIKLGGE